MFERVYNNPSVNVEKEKAVRVVEFLYRHYMKKTERITCVLSEFGC